MKIDTFYQAIRCRWTMVGRIRVMVIVAVFISVVLSSCGQFESPPSKDLPKLIIADSVASDFQTLAEETWDKFLTVFQARTNCFGDVRLRATRALDSRAAYDPDTATVTVRVPGTRAMLESALVHEWAHHLEFQCAAHKELRPAFLAAQRLPPDMLWRPDNIPVDTPESAWADIPSEQYAEATIDLVLGRRQLPTEIRVTQEAIHAIEVWAAGD